MTNHLETIHIDKQIKKLNNHEKNLTNKLLNIINFISFIREGKFFLHFF